MPVPWDGALLPGPVDRAHLLDSWLPALDGAVDKLRAGAEAADIGCGHGVTTDSDGAGLSGLAVRRDRLPTSRSRPREHAAQAGVANASFEVADATGYRGGDYDLIAFFDRLHDMADPAGAAAHARQSLKAGWPLPAGGTVRRGQPGGQPQSGEPGVLRGIHADLCAGLAGAAGPALGAQAGQRRLAEVMVDDGGFTQFRRVAETPFNLVFEGAPPGAGAGNLAIEQLFDEQHAVGRYRACADDGGSAGSGPARSRCAASAHREFDGITFHEILCKSALNKVPNAAMLPFRYTVNGYRGCSHACRYCFARPTHEYLDFDPGADFDTQVVVKTNVAEVLSRELRRPSWTRETVALGTNTDPISGPRAGTG